MSSSCCGKQEDFLLSNSVQSINKTSSGLCPHGCSPSACPICSGMGGGSTGFRAGERVQKAGEMSYHECAMLGNLMRAQKQRAEMHEKNLQSRAEAFQEFENKLMQTAQKMAEFANQISNSFIFKPVVFTINNIVVPVLNGIKNVSQIVNKILDKISQIKEKFIDIQDKLNAIFGELKNFIEKKISEIISAVKSKFEGLFKIFKKHNADDDDTKIDEDKKIFNLKAFIQKIWKKKKNDTEDKSRS